MTSDPQAANDVPDRFTVDFTGLTLLGIYRVEEKLADGGMGSIYRGVDTNLQRPVVIKVPHVRFLGEPGFRGRFRLEISELVRLEHPGIVRILAQGEHEDVPFFVLQFLGGGSLEEVLGQDDQPATMKDVLSWVAPIARTLDFVHGRGTVHRDVKPANILFDDDGNVYLSDFGVAKALGNEDAGLTAAGTGIGSPRYMAPEQAVGDDLDPTADQYALASMVYEALAGTPPFAEPSAIDLLVAKKSKDPAPLIEVAPHASREASDAVMRAIARDPAERFGSCHAFLEALTERPPAQAEPAGAAPASKLTLGVLAAGLALLVAIAVWAAGQGEEPEQAPAAVNEVAELRLTLLDPGAVDGRARLRYTLESGQREPIRMRMRKELKSISSQSSPPVWATPDIEWFLEMDVAEVTSDGSYPLTWRTTGLNFDFHEEAPAPFREAMERFKPLYKAFTCTVGMTPNGLARSAEMQLPEDTNEIIRRELVSLFWTVRNLAIPFPVEAVGIGAKWEVTENVDLVGIRLSHTTTYELQELDGERVKLVAYVAQTAARQSMNLQAVTKDAEATLMSLHTSGKTELRGDLRHVSPNPMHMDMKMSMEIEVYPVDEDGVRGEVSVDMSGTTEFKMELTVERTEGEDASK